MFSSCFLFSFIYDLVCEIRCWNFFKPFFFCLFCFVFFFLSPHIKLPGVDRQTNKKETLKGFVFV